MITPHNDDPPREKTIFNSVQPPLTNEAEKPPFALTKNTKQPEPQHHQHWLHRQCISHSPKVGLNPLVDAAAYLFSIIGKLKHLKSYGNLNQLHRELVTEISTFQDTVKAEGYSSEYLLVSRYTMCATLDDIISNTPWGGQGRWDPYSMLALFNQETTQQERFYLILERIIKDPKLYIDLMELMYICLSLGYKGTYSATEFSNNQLEKITHALYKRIRAHNGDYSKTLSPFPIRAPQSKTETAAPKISYGYLLFITASIIMILFIGLGYLLDAISNQAYQELMHIGKSTLYETTNKV